VDARLVGGRSGARERVALGVGVGRTIGLRLRVPAPVVGRLAPADGVAAVGATARAVAGGAGVFLLVTDDAGRGDADDSGDGGPVGIGRLVADFIAAYGWGCWHAPDVWPTGDGIVPARVFLAWTREASRRAALSQLRQTHAVSLGASSVMASKEGAFKIKQAMRALEVAAGVRPGEDDA
jgi:hypothetical protein